MVADKTEDQLADFIDKNASMIQVDYSKLDFPSLLGNVSSSKRTKVVIRNTFLKLLKSFGVFERDHSESYCTSLCIPYMSYRAQMSPILSPSDL